MQNIKDTDSVTIFNYEYYPTKKLGSGSYSNVYLGRNLINKCMLAIKKINLLSLSEKLKRMIREEVNIMQKIMKNPHPNIVKCIDIIDDIDTIYIIMEYCDGSDLSKFLDSDKTGKISETNAKYYFKQLYDGLCYLNENKIIHRDLKPKNILLTNNFQNLKICDFGLAKLRKDMTRVFTVCGSPLYMAPEILGEKSYDHSIDIWALGMILFEMLFGYNPFSMCKDIDELKDYIETHEVIQLPENNLSESCIDLLNKLLDKEYSTRINLKAIKNHKFLTSEIKENIIIDRNDHTDNNKNLPDNPDTENSYIFDMD
jgi:serine/threonine-protein kinase ULK/ATG1